MMKTISRISVWAALCLGLLTTAQATELWPKEKPVVLHLSGTEQAFSYNAQLLSAALEQAGYVVEIHRIDEVPTSRLEVLMLQGVVSAHVLGETAQRSERFLPIRIGMTDNLVGKRVLFIKPGDQARFDGITHPNDLRDRGLVGGLGQAWGDVAIWTHNDLPFIPQSGDWKTLYRMVASGQRGIDYLPRGAHEMALEWLVYPELAVEQHLVLVYERDHILYVSPHAPQLHLLLTEVMAEAERSGLIQQTARRFFQSVYESPVSLEQRRELRLTLPE